MPMDEDSYIENSRSALRFYDGIAVAPIQIERTSTPTVP